MPVSERPRERLRDLGPGALADAELIALVLGSGGCRQSALEIGRRLVASSRGLRSLAPRQWAEWLAEPGIGHAGAARLAAVFEIARRLRSARIRSGRAVRRPVDIARPLAARWGDERRELFGVILLDARNRVLREAVLSTGGWSASVVRPREVFREALLAGSPAIILFHNHPSGDPTPSQEDVHITRQIVDAGELLGIRVLDHLVVGSEGFASLRERRLM